MIVLTGYLNKSESKRLRQIFEQHDDEHSTAFPLGRRAKQCYFLEENSDSALLLSRLFQKFGGKINAHYISDVIMVSDIPRKYYHFIEKAFNNGDFKHSRWKDFKATDYAEAWEVLGYSYIDLENKTNGELWNEVRKAENRVKFGFGGV